MIYKNLLKDVKPSLLGFGCMRFPTDKDGKIDRNETKRLFEYAIKNGVNYFDTAYMYHDGESQDVTGELLSEYPRDSYYITNKLPVWMTDSPEAADAMFEEQLKRCKVNYFDFYLVHSVTAENFKKIKEYDVVTMLEKKRSEGKIKYLGFSFHDSPELLKEFVEYHKWDFGQLQINYLDWDMQRAKEQYEILEQNNIPCVVMEPVRGGALADLGEKGNEILKNAEPEKSIASWAIRYVASMPNVMTVLSGMSNFEQTTDNINTVSENKPITNKDKEILKSALGEYLSKEPIECTGCRYCMDCPAGVDIPLMFKMYNEYKQSGNKEEYLAKYNATEDNKKAFNCISCGKCAENCPQKINIPDKLKSISIITA